MNEVKKKLENLKYFRVLSEVVSTPFSTSPKLSGLLSCLDYFLNIHDNMISYYFICMKSLARAEMVCFSIHSQVTVQPKNNAAQELLSASTRSSSWT